MNIRAPERYSNDMNEVRDKEKPRVEPLRRAVGERYLQYALSTIMHRALPDARDGLKPVHRRILFAMRELKLSSTSEYRKSAKIAGDVMGNYHPHGDQAIYDALARLAQDFNMRYRLIDGQGNFGNIDGDNPAAARYTEARLAAAAEVLLKGLDENAVEFRPNYDGTLSEPVLLPAAFPNLLANGASGIAVGMATNIPPHNIGELCNACLHLLKRPNATDGSLSKLVPGPDFPTGGVIVEPADNIHKAYVAGRGTIRLRARWDKEDLGRGQWQVVVTEIPFQVQKSRLIEKIADLIQQRKVPLLSDVRDESADDIRIILDPRSRNVDAVVMMEALFRQSELETRFSLNMNALIDGRTPKVCSLKEILKAFLEHRREVLQRRSRHRLDKIARRLDVLEGHLTAFLNLDRVIEIIRNEDKPRNVLMEEFDLSEAQAEAILNMRLRSLRRLEELELRKEQDRLIAEDLQIRDLLKDRSIQWQRIAEEIKEVRTKFGLRSPGGARRTRFEEPPVIGEELAEIMIEREPLTVFCSEMGWIRTIKGHIRFDQNLKYRDGDKARFILHALTTDKLVLAGTNGMFYALQSSQLPGGRGMGEPVRLMVDLPNDANAVALFVHDPKRQLVVVSDAGFGFVVRESDVLAATRNGKRVLNLAKGVQTAACVPISGDTVAVVSSDRMLTMFPVADLPVMSRGKGVLFQRYEGTRPRDVMTFKKVDGLQWLDPAGRTRTQKDLGPWLVARPSRGAEVPHGFPQSGTFHGNEGFAGIARLWS